VFLSQEAYQQMQDQDLSRTQLIEEQERKLEAMEIQLKSTREQFEYQSKALLDTKRELERIAVHHLHIDY
jgi:kinesin family member 11